MSNLKEFDIGDSPTISAAFKVSGVLTDPTTIAVAVTDPSGNTDNYTYAGGTVTKDGTGEYSKQISVDEAGEWTATFTGTGTCAATGVVRFAARRSGS